MQLGVAELLYFTAKGKKKREEAFGISLNHSAGTHNLCNLGEII